MNNVVQNKNNAQHDSSSSYKFISNDFSSSSSIHSFSSSSLVSPSSKLLNKNKNKNNIFSDSLLSPSLLSSSLNTAVNPEAASVHLCTDKWLSVISEMRLSSAFKLSGSDLDELEQHIKFGISLPLDEQPSNIKFSNTTTVTEHHSAVADRIAEYISIGAVQQLPSSSCPPDLVQPLHVIMKQGKKPRLVIDLSRNLNELLPHTAFKYTSVHDAVLLSTHQCFYSKLDISNCFLSFPLHPSEYKYFVFQFDGVYYQFVRLPFGLSTAPRVCTLLLSVIQFVLEQKQLRLVRYLDDFLFISSSFADASKHLAIAIQVFQDFGLVVNNDKTEGPAQQIQFLGINLDSVSRTLSISNERIEEMNELLSIYVEISVT